MKRCCNEDDDCCHNQRHPNDTQAATLLICRYLHVPSDPRLEVSLLKLRESQTLLGRRCIPLRISSASFTQRVFNSSASQAKIERRLGRLCRIYWSSCWAGTCTAMLHAIKLIPNENSTNHGVISISASESASGNTARSAVSTPWINDIATLRNIRSASFVSKTDAQSTEGLTEVRTVLAASETDEMTAISTVKNQATRFSGPWTAQPVTTPTRTPHGSR